MSRPLVSFALFTTSLLAGCTQSSTHDELAGESAQDGEAGKGDSTSAFTYFAATPDLRACSPSARCGGYFVDRPNRSTVNCGIGLTTNCYVDRIDWTPVGLPASVAKSYEDRLRSGEPLLFRGSVTSDLTGLNARLNVTEIWVPNGSGPATGVFVLARDNGVMCNFEPCPSITEHRLNSTLDADIDEVDFTASGAPEAAIAHARDELFSAGVIIIGDRYAGDEGATGRAARQFFTKAPIPAQ